jgi:uncharacterized protein (DUF2252 family)
MNKADHKIHALVPVDLYKQASRVADLRDETVSQVIRRALREYVASAPRQGDLEEAIRATKKRSLRNGT